MKKTMTEFNVPSLWGKIAMVSWGDPSKPPILLVHGYMDSAATFILLVDHLPDNYYYVALDMPGHGKSDPFPVGGLVSHLNLASAINTVVEYMNWETFIYVAHSMGSTVGLFYNHFYPGKITKMVLIDPAPPLSMYYYPPNKPSYWFQYLYDAYYSDYDRWNAPSIKRYTFDEAVNLLVRNRSLSEDQAEIILSRSLVPVGDGKYRLSWQSRMKKVATVPVSEDTVYTFIAQDAPPILVIEAAENRSVLAGKKFVKNLLEKCRLMVPGFSTVTVAGGHDVHITNPEIVSPLIKEFLKPETGVKAKL